MGWYPGRSSYYAAVDAQEDVEQGDIFWGVPSLVATHPAIGDQFRPPGTYAEAEQLEPPPLSEVVKGIRVHDDAVIVMPHTCDFYGPEKGRTQRERLVARIRPLAGSEILDPRRLRSGEGYGHTFFLPSWRAPENEARDCFVNLRSMTTVDVSYLSRARRLARLSPAAVICLRRRVTHFFTDYAPMASELVEADLRGGLLRGERALISQQDLRQVLGDEAVNDLLRRLRQRVEEQ